MTEKQSNAIEKLAQFGVLRNAADAGNAVVLSSVENLAAELEQLFKEFGEEDFAFIDGLETGIGIFRVAQEDA